MSFTIVNLPSTNSFVSIDTRTGPNKVIMLPAASTVTGRLFTIKDQYGGAALSTYTLSTIGMDKIDGRNWIYTFSNAFGAISFLSDGRVGWRVVGLYDGTSTAIAPLISTERFPLVQTSGLIVKLDGASYSAGGSTWTSSVNSSVWSMSGTTYDAATQAVVFSSSYAYTSSVTSFNATVHSVVMYYYRNGNSPNAAGWGGYTAGACLYQINRSGSSADNEIVVYEPAMWDYSSGVGGLALAFNANTSLAGTTGWKMRAYVKNGATGTFYLNGSADGTSTGSVTASIGNGDFAIGRDYRDGIAFLNAKVALFAMWNVALSSTDITNIHNACKDQFGL